jgi:hypothetical protein
MSQDDQVIVGVLRALVPHLRRLVVIGGWVPELHRRWGSEDWAVAPARTIELDVLLEGEGGGEDGGLEDLGKALRAEGFAPLGDDGPAVVWARDVGLGERIEFFVDHRGPWATSMTAEVIASESGLSGVRLADATPLLEYAIEIAVFGDDGGASMNVRVPELGVFLCHKGATFRRRSDAVKCAKDLEYIVDVMRSGDGVVSVVEGQIRSYCSAGGGAARLARAAHNLVSLVLRESPVTVLRSALAEAIAERENVGRDEADALALGSLADFVDLIPEDCG